MATPSSTPSPPPPPDPNPNPSATPPHQNQPPPSSLTTATQTPPSPRNTVVALAASSTTSAAARKTQPVLWTEDETFLLIDSYKEKWYAVGRGPLRSNQWEEISVAVSARSGVERSSTQCRHKMEKLRKRFRAERQSMGPISIWPFYSQMEELDSNPGPISARPLTRLPPPPSNHYAEDEDEDEDDEEDESMNKSRSINHIVRRPGTVNRFAGVGGGGLLQWGQKERSKRKRIDDGGGGGERRKGASRAVAYEIRSFAEKVMVMEKKRMEFAKETVKLRKEMEIKRVKLIQSSQAQLLQSLNSAFGSSF